MSQPLKLHDIYTNVNVLEKISGRRRLEVADLLKVSVSDEFERPQLGRIATSQMNGLEAVTIGSLAKNSSISFGSTTMPTSCWWTA